MKKIYHCYLIVSNDRFKRACVHYKLGYGSVWKTMWGSFICLVPDLVPNIWFVERKRQLWKDIGDLNTPPNISLHWVWTQWCLQTYRNICSWRSICRQKRTNAMSNVLRIQRLKQFHNMYISQLGHHWLVMAFRLCHDQVCFLEPNSLATYVYATKHYSGNSWSLRETL